MTSKTLGKAARMLNMHAKASPKQGVVLFQETLVPKTTEFKHAACYGKSSDITVREGQGCWVTDVEGRRYLDVTSGIAVLSTGHCHPRVVEAVQKQSATIMHGQLNCFQSHTALDGLLEKLGPKMPKGLNTFVVDTTGTQAIEAAVKLARRHTRKPNVICMMGGFHGRSALTSAMTSSNTGPRYPVATPLPSGVYYTQPPLAFRWGVSEEEAVKRALASFKDLFSSQLPIDTVAAVVAEPIMGEGGFIQLPKAYLEGVKAICEEHGILLIADEVQAGVGRSGKMWASEHTGVIPDIMVSAKGIASGMPLSLVASTEEIMSSYTPGSHGGTYMGNPVACAAATATLEVIEEEGLVENSASQGAMLKAMLTEMKNEYFPHGDVRGTGLMIGLELRDEEGPSPALAQHIRKHCLDNGVLLYAPSGWDSCTLRIMPPLIIQEHEALQIAFSIEASLKDWKAKQA